MKEGKNTDTVHVYSEVFALMAAHASSHPTAPVHGVLVGNRQGTKVSVTDAFPICHEHPTKTLVETAFALVQSVLEETNQSIVGWFTAPELLHDTSPGPSSLRIVANLDTAMETEPILLVLNNSSMVDLVEGTTTAASQTFQAYGKDFGMQWMDPIEKVIVSEEEKAVTTAIGLVSKPIQDLVDHWQNGPKSEWTWASTLCIS